VRLTAGMNQDGGTTDIDNDPTKAHSREDIRRSLAEHGVEMKTGDATNPDGIAAESTLEEDPTKLYDPESVRRAVTGDSPPIFGDETEPIGRSTSRAPAGKRAAAGARAGRGRQLGPTERGDPARQQ